MFHQAHISRSEKINKQINKYKRRKLVSCKKIASIVTFGSYRCSETQAMPGKQERSEGEFQHQFS